VAPVTASNLDNNKKTLKGNTDLCESDTCVLESSMICKQTFKQVVFSQVNMSSLSNTGVLDTGDVIDPKGTSILCDIKTEKLLNTEKLDKHLNHPEASDFDVSNNRRLVKITVANVRNIIVDSAVYKNCHINKLPFFHLCSEINKLLYELSSTIGFDQQPLSNLKTNDVEMNSCSREVIAADTCVERTGESSVIDVDQMVNSECDQVRTETGNKRKHVVVTESCTGGILNTSKDRKPYACPHCQAKFTSKILLEGHEVTHTARMTSRHTNNTSCSATDAPSSITDQYLSSCEPVIVLGNDLTVEETFESISRLEPTLALKQMCSTDHSQSMCSTDHSKSSHCSTVSINETASNISEIVNSKQTVSTGKIRNGTRVIVTESCRAGVDCRSSESLWCCPHCDEQFNSSTRLKRHVRQVHGQVKTEEDDKPYACTHCQKTFAFKKSLKQHEVTHSGETGYACTGCDKQYLNSDLLNAHVKLRHRSNGSKKTSEKSPSSCGSNTSSGKNVPLGDACQSMHESESTDDIEEMLSAGVQPQLSYSGDVALNESVSSISNIVPKHTRSMLLSDGNKCLFVHEKGRVTFDKHIDLEKYKVCHDVRPRCGLCVVKFETVLDLHSHYKSDHRSGPNNTYACTKCNLKARTVTKFRIHIQSHVNTDERKLFTCTLCDRTFRTTSSLNKHVDIVHNGVNYYTCSQCKMKFNKNQLDTFRLHRKTHSDERPFVCAVCNKGYMTRHTLSNHTRVVHKKVCSNVCPQCGKAYNGEGLLLTHIRQVHTGERPFICTQCGKGFTCYMVLKRHEDSHAKERKYRCKQCDQRFVTSSNLSSHIRIVHENVRPFSCTQCEKIFSSKSHLNHHMASHTGERAYACKYCDKRFSQPSCVYRHITVSHSVRTDLSASTLA